MTTWPTCGAFETLFFPPSRCLRYLLTLSSIIAGPWWLVRKGKLERAAKSVERLGRKKEMKTPETVAMMRRVIELEATTKSPGYLELFKGTDLRRTLIVCGVYAAQNLTGNLIANQAVYFFTRR